MLDLFGRTAIITGAGSGIGAAVSEKLFERNCNIVMIAKSQKNVQKVAEKLVETKQASHQGTVEYYACDVRKEKELATIKDRVLMKDGKIDILVTCAAAPAASGKAEEITYEDWKSVMQTELDGAFLSCKIFGTSMISKGYGRIVNLTSFHTIATYPERVVYNVAKSGVEGLTRALAVEWGKYGITINAVAPGPIITPRTSWFLSQSPDIGKGMLSRTPNRRLGEAEDVAELIAFLVSEEAKHINGQQIVIDGGWTKSAWWGSYCE